MNKSIIKREILGFFACITFVFFSCAGNNRENNTEVDSKKTAEDHNDAKFDKSAEKDAQFLVDVATINLNEIQLGDLAATKGISADVKNLGQSMSAAHTKAQAELTALAQKKGITLPTSVPDEAMRDYNSLKDEDFKDFDVKYSNMMVDGHKDAISKFEKASTDSEDAEIRDWAAKMLPILREHLDHAMNCQNKLKST
jgi:putative membrane protein